MKIHRTVAAFAPESDFVIRFFHGQLVSEMLATGQAVERASDKRRGVTEITIAPVPRKVTARPGSFGIHRERIAAKDNGVHAGLVYSHKRTHEQELVAA